MFLGWPADIFPAGFSFLTRAVHGDRQGSGGQDSIGRAMFITKSRIFPALALLVFGMAGCLSGGGTPASTATAATSAASIILASSVASIKADGSTSTTITATVVDAARLPVSGATIEFTATSGQFGVSSGVSSTGGTVTIAYSALASSGTVNSAERTETITAKVVGSSVTSQIPIKVTSTAVAPAASLILASSAASIKADGSTSTTLTATVVDANGWAVAGATVRFAVKSGSGHFLTANSGPSSAASGIVTISYSALSSSGTANLTDHTDIVSAEVVGTGVTGEISIPVTASSLSLMLGASVPSIKTDGSNSATITASVIDSFRAPVSGQKVTFSVPTGLLGTSSGDSKTDGTVTIPFTALSLAGKADRTNRTEVVTASIVGTAVTAQIPIQISGSTLTLVPSKSTAQVGEAITLTATTYDAATVGVNAQSTRFSVDSRSTGAGTLSATTATTGTSGSTPAVTLTATAPGSVIINADWLNAAGSSTVTTSTIIIVTSVDTSFEVISPTTNPTSLALSDFKAIDVSVPTSISGVPVANVRFATTLGTWSNPGAGKTSTKTPVAKKVSETLTAGAYSGNANIQIDALDSSGKVLATLNRVFALSAAKGTLISLQASVATVAPSAGGTTNSTTLTATVRDAAHNTVGNAPVLFEIVNPTGSGEQINPVVVYTNSNGVAVTTFTSGSVSTVGGLQIKGSLVGVVPEVSDSKTINVSGTSVSVTLGQSNQVASSDNGTTYTLPMSVLVVSSTGGAVSGATVTLSAFPTHYYRGSRDLKEPSSPTFCTIIPTKAKLAVPGTSVTVGETIAFPNEDVNENDILDPSEDYDPIGDDRGLGSITPPHAAAGTLPPTVVTNTNGVGGFNLIYLKNYANWVDTRIQAKVVVNGTEFVNELKFNLPVASGDRIPDCTLPNSPFGL